MERPYHFIKKRKSLVSLTAGEKLRILDEMDANCNIMRVAEKYGVDSSTLRKWKKNRTKIQATYEISANSKRCKLNPNKWTNDAVFLWFQKMRSRGIVVSGTIIKEKAISFHKRIGGSESFVASTGWLDWWKKKYNIRRLGTRSATDPNVKTVVTDNCDEILSDETLENVIIEQMLEEAKQYENFVQAEKSDPVVKRWSHNNYSQSEESKDIKTVQVWLNENICKKEREDTDDEQETMEENLLMEEEKEEKVITPSEALEGLHKVETFFRQNGASNEVEENFRNVRLLLESKIN